jgi:hypothetical protein
MEQLLAYPGVDWIERLELVQDGERVPANTVTRAMFSCPDFCLDTDNADHAEIIFFEEDRQVLGFNLGLVSTIDQKKSYRGCITLFDAETEKGYPWAEVRIRVRAWQKCSV